MTASRTIAEIGRAAARAAAALVVLLFALAPAFDAAACAVEDEGARGAAVHATAFAAATADIAGHEGGAADIHGLCAHGHCHHAAASWPARELAAEPTPGVAAAERPAPTRLPPSREPAGLERPPRS